jgi:hypothetical protein
VAEQSKGAIVKGFSTEIDNGKKLYEVQLTVDRHGRDVSIDEGGRVVEVEEEVARASLSPAVRDGLGKAAGTGTIAKVESLTKNGKLVAYEAVVQKRKKRSEIQVGPDGKKLTHPEQSGSPTLRRTPGAVHCRQPAPGGVSSASGQRAPLVS